MSNKAARLLLVGCGAMGGALLKGWAKAKVGGGHITIVCPQEQSVQPFRDSIDITWAEKPENLDFDYTPDVVVFAVKPQILDQVLPHYLRYALGGALCVSIAAGKNLEFYSRYLGKTAAVVKMMPNLPVAYRKGMLAALSNDQVNDDQLSLAHRLAEAVGKVLWLEQEDQFNAVTAVSGSGPAYLYALTECLVKAGESVGLSAEQAELLARQTMIGAGTSLEHSADSAMVMKQRVTSPGGGTEAALKVLEASDGLQYLMEQAIKAATERYRELAS